MTVDRRTFLRTGSVSFAAALLGACGSSGPDSAEPALKYLASKNEGIERWLFRHNSIDRAKAHAIASGDRFPSYFVSDRVPLWDPAVRGGWKLEVGGMVRRPLSLSLEDLMGLASSTQRINHYCVEGWTAVAEFSGVKLATLAALAEVDRAARSVDFESFDSDYHESWDIDSAMHPQTLVVLAKDGRTLTPAYGAPARVHSPVKLGYKNTKYLTRIVFLPKQNGGYWSDRGYEWYGGL